MVAGMKLTPTLLRYNCIQKENVHVVKTVLKNVIKKKNFLCRFLSTHSKEADFPSKFLFKLYPFLITYLIIQQNVNHKLDRRLATIS